MEANEGYIQHSQEAIRAARLALYELAKPSLEYWITAQKENHGMTDERLAIEVHPSWHGRMLDGGCDPLERAYSRLCCIDSHGREWQQPYFATNPGSGKQVRLP